MTAITYKNTVRKCNDHSIYYTTQNEAQVALDHITKIWPKVKKDCKIISLHESQVNNNWCYCTPDCAGYVCSKKEVGK